MGDEYVGGVMKCLCGSERPYLSCCEVYHLGAVAPSPEALMRSRYCAYVLNLNDYLLATWHVSTRPESMDEGEPLKWLGLSVKRAWMADSESEGFVDFVAKYKVGGGGAVRLHEVSRFVREDGRWFYVDGVFVQ